jgi:hypothetical protein
MSDTDPTTHDFYDQHVRCPHGHEHLNAEPCWNCRSLPGFMLTRKVLRDGEIICQLKCPGCQTWGDIDDDQWHGKVSIDCPTCDFHETVHLSQEEWRTPFKGPKNYVHPG